MLEQYHDIMTVYDVAEALYIGKNRVYELLKKGELKGFRIGGYGKSKRKQSKNTSRHRAN